MKGWIFDIKKFAVHDGPGIRTTIFLKGCPLSCIWCHNPEGINGHKNLWFFGNKCIGCGSCISTCRQKALSQSKDERREILIDHSLCNKCGDCIASCPTGALSFDGWKIDADEAVSELLQDRIFYEKSGGGITISGGDPLFQHKFSREILERCKNEGLHTAIETSMYAKKEIFESFFGLVDFFIVDLKLFDSRMHKKYTGTDNRLILENFRNLSKNCKDILVRIPLIPGITATEENIKSIARFTADTAPGTGIELINFNPLAENKYRLMGRENESLMKMKPYTEEELDSFYRMLAIPGIRSIRDTSVSLIATEKGE